jgi:hypothetical protein
MSTMALPAEPVKPVSQARLAPRHVFVLMAVGARHDEAGQATPRELRAQRRHARCAGAALGSIFERLEAGFEHGGNLLSPLQPGNDPRRAKAMRAARRPGRFLYLIGDLGLDRSRT